MLMNKMKIKNPRYRFQDFFNNNWEKVKFKKYIKLYRGSSPRPIQDFLTNENGINWIKIGDTKNSKNYIISSVEEQITKEGAKQSRFVEKGELILANSMSYGNTYELGLNGCIYDGWFVLREYGPYFNKTFLKYQLNSNLLQYQYKRLSAGGIVKNISSDIVYATKLFYTSEKEQEKIAECLKSVDDLILSEEEKLEKLKSHKNGLLQKLFPQQDKNIPELRFPKFNQKWDIKKLDNICIFRNGGSYENNIVENGKYNLITLNSIDIDGNLKDKHHTIEYGDWYLRKNDIVMILSDVATGRFLGLSALIPQNNKFVLNQRVGLLRTNKNKSPDYIRYFINQNQKYFMTHGQGANQKNLSKEDILSFCIKIPKKIEEQQKIADCISSIDDLISVQIEKIEALKQHKKSLLQGLFPSIEEVDNE